MTVGRIHSVETFGSVDGPGVRFVVFVQGCNMRCRFCHNADTWALDQGELRSVDDVLKQALRYRSYWGSEGGITVSGGEPLLQMDFVKELFVKAKALGIHTCIDTALQPFSRDPAWLASFDALLDVTDLLLCDIKQMDPAGHRSLTGRDNANILDGFSYLCEKGKPIWVRYVLVPGVNDADEDLRAAGAFLKPMLNVKRIEVLPYHSMGAYKWKKLGYTYTLDGVETPGREKCEHAQRLLEGEE